MSIRGKFIAGIGALFAVGIAFNLGAHGSVQAPEPEAVAVVVTTTEATTTTTTTTTVPPTTTTTTVPVETREYVYVGLLREYSWEYEHVTWVDLWSDDELIALGVAYCTDLDDGFTFEDNALMVLDHMGPDDPELAGMWMTLSIAAFCPEYGDSFLVWIDGLSVGYDA